MRLTLHQFNSQPRNAQEAADFAIGHYDAGAREHLKTVKDYSTVVQCNRALDRLLPKFWAWYRGWIEKVFPKSKQPSRKAQEAVRQRLLRRAEHWKAEAQAIYLAGTGESPQARCARRQRVVNPLLKKAGITSDEGWAERAGENIDRNTPRDYRSGKTKRLRKATRQALARALGIRESELPE